MYYLILIMIMHHNYYMSDRFPVNKEGWNIYFNMNQQYIHIKICNDYLSNTEKIHTHFHPF